jgi:hypothetical protein
MPILPPSFDRLYSDYRRLLTTLSIVVSTASLCAQPTVRTVESQSAPVKDYRLFVGMDLMVLHQGEYAKMDAYSDHGARLAVGDRPVVDVRLNNRTRFERTPRVGRNALQIQGLSTRRDYSIIDSTAQNWSVQQATVQSTRTQTRLTGDLKTRGNPTARGQRAAQDNTFYNPDTTDDGSIEEAQNNEISLQLDSEFYADDGKQKSETKTALIIEAMVSSPVPVSEVYLVGVARVVAQGQQKDVVLFSEARELSREPRMVQLRKEELPLNLEVLEVDLHVYRAGHELVSNLSDKQFGLTRDEAHEYVSLDHMGMNRNASMAGFPAWSLPPAALLSAQDPRAFDYPVQVSIDDRGRFVSIDESIVLPDHIRTIVEEMVFVPALVEGQPIASNVSFNLMDYFR